METIFRFAQKQETHKMRLYIPPNDANNFRTLREKMIAEETIANFG